MTVLVDVPGWPSLVGIGAVPAALPRVGEKLALLAADSDYGVDKPDGQDEWFATVTQVAHEVHCDRAARGLRFGLVTLSAVADGLHVDWSVEEYGEFVRALGWDCEDLGPPQRRADRDRPD